jgi:phage baseplate assembly protein W
MSQSEIEDYAFLGRGLSFPPTFSLREKDIQMVAGAGDIEQSLEIILGTRPGERALESSFGCNLDELLFESIDLSLISFMQEVIRTALILHEPRINVNEVTIEQDDALEGKLLIKIDYTVRSTNSRFNFVYPFYLEEGTDLDL